MKRFRKEKTMLMGLAGMTFLLVGILQWTIGYERG